MSKYFVFIYFILTVWSLSAQVSYRDSIRIHGILDSAQALIEEDNTLAFSKFELADSLSRVVGYPLGIGLSAKGVGVLYDLSGNSEEAIISYNKALQIYDEHKITGDPVADIDLNKGVAYYYKGENDKALDNYLKAYRGYKESNNQKRISSILNNLGIIYRIQSDYDKSLQAYEESLNIKMAFKDTIGIAKNLENIAALYAFKNQIDSAIYNYQKAKDLYLLSGNLRRAQAVELSLGISYYQVNDYDNAIRLLESRYKSPVLDNSPYKLKVSTVLALCESYREVGQYEKALRVCSENLEYLEDKGLLVDKADVNLALSRIHVGLKNYKNAFFHQDQYVKYYKEQVEESKLELEEEVTARFDLLEKDNKIKSQELNIANQQKIRDRLIGGIGIISIAALLFFFLLRNRTKHNKVLNEKNSIIQESLNQRETLLKEIHHRVKNNLQIVSSLLNLQRRYQSDEQTSRAFMDGRNRVQSMALIHQLLYQQDVLTSVNARDYTEKLVRSLYNAYKIDEESVLFKNEVDNIYLDVDTLIPIGLILNELVTNALKYGVGKTDGFVEVRLNENHENLHLAVMDSGRNFPGENENLFKNSFGFNLIQSLSRKLDATIHIIRNPNTMISLTIQNYKLIS